MKKILFLLLLLPLIGLSQTTPHPRGARFPGAVVRTADPRIPVMTSNNEILGYILKTDLELALGNPSSDGDILSSTAAGVRSWITPSAGGATAWGSITGTLADQTDLNTALNARLLLTGGTMAGILNMGSNNLNGVNVLNGVSATFTGTSITVGGTDAEFNRLFTRFFPHNTALTGSEGVLFANDTENRLQYHNGTSFVNVLLEGDVAAGGGQVNTVVSGQGTTVDATDPVNPVVDLGGTINEAVSINIAGTVAEDESIEITGTSNDNNELTYTIEPSSVGIELADNTTTKQVNENLSVSTTSAAYQLVVTSNEGGTAENFRLEANTSGSRSIRMDASNAALNNTTVELFPQSMRLRTPAVDAGTATVNQVLQLTNAGTGEVEFATVASGGGLNNVVEDTTPQLGGQLDAQENGIINLGFNRWTSTTFGFTMAAVFGQETLPDPDESYWEITRFGGGQNLRYNNTNNIWGFSQLTGTGDRMVVANDEGELSTQAIPAGGAGLGIIASGSLDISNNAGAATVHVVTHNLGFIPEINRIHIRFSDVVSANFAGNSPTITDVTETTFSFNGPSTGGDLTTFANWAIFGTGTVTPTFGVIASGSEEVGEETVGTIFTVTHSLGFIPSADRIVMNLSDIVSASPLDLEPKITAITTTTFSFTLGSTTGAGNDLFVNWSILGQGDVTPVTEGHVISYQNSNLTQRSQLNFSGNGFRVTDDSLNEKTDVVVGVGFDTGGTTTNLRLSNPLGYYYGMGTANTNTTYTISTETGFEASTGGWAKVRINAATQPTVTGATLIDGADFIASTDMYMIVSHNGFVTEYFFLKIAP